MATTTLKHGLQKLLNVVCQISHHTVDALLCMKDKEVVDLFSRNAVLKPDELEARLEILLEGYAGIIKIEGKTALSMAKRQILPAAIKFSGDLCFYYLLR